MVIAEHTFGGAVELDDVRCSHTLDAVTIGAYVSDLLKELLLDCDTNETRKAVHFDGVLLFIDIAGSTSIVNQFGEAGPEGVETLHRLLNRYFGTIFDIVEAHCGDVIGIYGDAVLAVWRSGGRRDVVARMAARAALRVRERLRNWSPEPGVSLQQRLVLSGGPLSAFAYRSEVHPSFFVVTGEPIRALAAALHSGELNDIVLTDTLVPHFADDGLQRSQSGVWRLISLANDAAAEIQSSGRAADDRVESLARVFVPRMVADRVLAANAEWLAEFRVLTVVFVQLSGLESDSLTRIQDAVLAIEEAIGPFGLTMFDLAVDDKGVVAVVASGLPPFAHERNALRALQAARQIHGALLGIGVQSSLGISTGRAFCGDVGSGSRRECLITGPAMHLAAALMGAAAGGILCDSTTIAETLDFFNLPEPTSVLVKGLAGPLTVYRGDDLKPASRGMAKAGKALHGRDDEIHVLAEAFDELAEGHHVVISIEAEPGAGKSRLLSHVGLMARGGRFTLIETATSPIEVTSAYYACRTLLRQLLLRPSDPASSDARLLRERLDEALHGESLHAKAALVEDILPLGIEDKGLASEITGPARFAGLEDIFARLASRRAAMDPLVLLVDDVHWLDDPSARLLLAVARRVDRILMVMTTRPLDDAVAPAVRALYGSATRTLSLRRLGRGAILGMTCDLLGVRSVPPRVADFVFEHSEGLPFHAEQLVLSLRDRAVLSVSDGRCRVESELSAGVVPSSLRDLIVSRVDGLDAIHQVAVKVASVLGRTFQIDILRKVLPFTLEAPALAVMLDHLAKVGILDFAGEGALCAFRHILIQEATYELLTFDQRQPLHRRIAAYMEEHYAHDLEPHYAEVADHCERAGQFNKAVEYWRKAAQVALSRYANYEALSHVDRIEHLAGRMTIALGRPQAGELAQIRADACHELSRFTEAQRYFKRCAALNGIPVPASRVRLAASTVREMARQTLHRFGLVTAPLDPETQAKERLTAHIYTRLAEHAYFNGDALWLVHGTLTSLNHAERIGSVAEIVEGYGGLSIGLGTAGLHRLARFYRDSSIARAEAEGRLHDQGFAHLLAAVYSFSAGEWATTTRHCSQGAAICHRIGDRFRDQSCRVVEAYARILTGQYDAAEDMLRSLGDYAEEVENIPVRAWVLAGRAIMDMIRGHPPAVALARLSYARDETLHRGERLLCDGLEALAYLEAGDTESALHAADRGLANMIETPPTLGIAIFSVAGVAEVYLARAEDMVENGMYDGAVLVRAKAACRAARVYAAKIPIGRSRSFLLDARLAMLLGRRSRAQSQWRKALLEARDRDMPIEQSFSLLGLAEASSDPEQCRGYEEGAREMLLKLGANPWRCARRARPSPSLAVAALDS